MNFRRKLARKLAMVTPIVVMAVLMIALVAIPAGALNQMPAPPGGGTVLNSPGPVPTMLNYQGYLTDASGSPINGTVGMTFSIYTTAVGGMAVWTETQSSVSVTDGLFNVLLGSVNPIKASHLTGTSYLGVKVGADPEMTPRQRMVSVAYAFHAETLGGMDSTDFVAVAGDTMTGALNLPANGLVAGTDQLVLTGGKVGIGTTDPGSYKLNVVGGTSSGIYANSSSGYGVYGKHNSSGNLGVLGSSGGGVSGEHSSSGNYGLLGTSNEGVYGYNSSSGNRGWLGTSNYGVYGYNSGSGNFGRLGTSNYGVYGSSSESTGVWGSSSIGTGVEGYSYSDIGVYGSSSSGYGVVGRHTNSGNFGRLGTSDYGVYGSSTSDYGVYGSSTDDYGVRGYSTNYYGVGGTGTIGVWGNGSQWDFYAGNNKYGPFTGGHEVKLSADFPEDIKPGLIVSVTGETQVRTDEGEISYSSTLPTVQLSETPNDSRVFGVFTSESSLPEDHWYESGEEDRFGIVNALGEGRVWVTNINGDIEAGDYITTSLVTGYGQRQDDDLLHSYTLGKAIEDVDWSKVTETVEFNGQTYKAYPIAVVYTSG